MLRKAFFIASFLYLGNTVASQAQQSDNYIYVTDEINNASFGDSKLSGRVARNFSINDTQYSAYAEYHKISNYISLPTEDDFGIVATTSAGLLKKIEIQWTNLGNGIAPVLQIFTQDYPFNAPDDLYTDEVGKCAAQIVQDKDVVTPEGLHIQSADFTSQSRYFGVKPYGNYVHFRSIRVTWQLGYFFDDMHSHDLRAICAPYDIAAEDFHALSAYYLVGKIVEGNKVVRLVFEKVSSISAGVPCLLRAEENNAYAMYSGKKAEAAQPTCGMHGTLTESTLEGDAFIIVDNKAIPVCSGTVLTSNQAYIVMDEVPEISTASLSDSMITLEIEGDGQMGETPTFVEEEGLNNRPTRFHCFDLQGRKKEKGGCQILIKNDRKWLQMR